MTSRSQWPAAGGQCRPHGGESEVTMSKTGYLGRPARRGRRVGGPSTDRATGLGDVVANVTSAVGIKPCDGCKKRQESLNKLVPFKKN